MEQGLHTEQGKLFLIIIDEMNQSMVFILSKDKDEQALNKIKFTDQKGKVPLANPRRDSNFYNKSNLWIEMDGRTKAEYSFKFYTMLSHKVEECIYYRVEMPQSERLRVSIEELWSEVNSHQDEFSLSFFNSVIKWK